MPQDSWQNGNNALAIGMVSQRAARFRYDVERRIRLSLYIFSVVAPTSDKNHFEVIDGQQRLTTFFLILCALRQLFKGEAQEKTISNLVTTDYTGTDGETRVSLKLSPRYENADEFVSKLVEINSDPATVRNGIRNAAITSFGSLENLLDVYATIHRYLREAYGDIKELKKFWGYLAK